MSLLNFKQYDVTLEPDNGGLDQAITKTVAENTVYTIPECSFNTPEGKKFKAWEVDGEEKMPGDELIIIKDTIITAQWDDLLTDFAAVWQKNTTTDPTEPSTPLKTIKQSDSKKSTDQTEAYRSMPKTGESSGIYQWLSLLLLSVSSLLLIMRKKRLSKSDNF